MSNNTRCFMLLAIVSTLMFAGCSYVKQPNDRKMKKLVNGMPEYEANEYFGKRDLRFIVVRDGEQITTPQLPDCLVEKFGTRELTNEDYAPGTYDYEKYAALARPYAKYFNQTLVALMADRGWDKCNGQGPADS